MRPVAPVHLLGRLLGENDRTLFLLSSGLLVGAGGILALLKEYILLTVLGFSVPAVLLIIHLNVLPVFAVPLAGVFYGFDRAASRDHPEETADEEFTVVVPVREEGGLLVDCVDSILQHPGARVRVIHEADPSTRTRRALDEVESRDRAECLVNPPRHAGSKAGALNFALEESETEIMAVFDSDHRANEGSMDLALQRFTEDEELAYLSGRTVKRESDMLGKIGYGESLLFHQIPSLVMDRLFGFHMLTTTNCFFRRGAVAEVGGFDSTVLTEDMELGVELFLADEKIAYDPSVVSEEGSARNVRDWWGQKKRWIRGSLEVSRRNHVKPLVQKPGLSGLALSLTLLIIPFMYPLTVLISGFLLVSVLTGGIILSLPLLAPGLLVAYLALQDSRRGVTHGPSPYHLLSPFFLMLASFVGMKAVWEELLDRDAGWYRVSR